MDGWPIWLLDEVSERVSYLDLMIVIHLIHIDDCFVFAFSAVCGFG